MEKWYSSVDRRPGFTSEAFRVLNMLKAHTAAAASNGKVIACSLLMDEIAIRQKVEWDGTRYHGYIDMGTELDDDSMSVAKEALTFLVFQINDNFKLPVGYFLIDGLDATARSNVVSQCWAKLYNVNINVVSLTFDGVASNIAMVKILECNLDCSAQNFTTSFPHPITQAPVVVFLDPCHMLKLVQNTLVDKKSMFDEHNEFIKFEFIVKLHKL